MPDRCLLADRYLVGELLGTGGVAEVRRARDVVLARDVAVKLFGPTADTRRFDNEVRTLAALSHPGLVPVYDADSSGDTPFMVLELVEGRTLRDHIANGPMEVGEVRRLGAALADALAYVHSRGLIHRDVKPSNILLDSGGVPRLADFGLARLVDGARLTRADQVVGTAAYLAPEQVRGGEITSAVDVYALGLVLLECLTGRREYEGSEIEAAVARLHRSPVVPDDLPFDLVRLLSLMTSLSAERRPTARECADALLAADPPTRVAPVARRRSPVVLAAASAAVLIAAIGTGFALHDRDTPVESAPPASPVSTQPGTVEQTPVPVVEQPVVQTTVPQPVQEHPKAKQGKGKGKKK
ncbi:serine/threonine-protein kinase [Lentzea sp. NPDC004782]|uniref:serine/threonine-protein kinase n=1 Tax=Lentzea sp. NPDC004782 TaxID=3154458 RepID=UPI0033BDFB8E